MYIYIYIHIHIDVVYVYIYIYNSSEGPVSGQVKGDLLRDRVACVVYGQAALIRMLSNGPPWYIGETPCDHLHPQHHKHEHNVETNCLKIADAHITSLHMFWSLVSKWSGVGVGVFAGALNWAASVAQTATLCRRRHGRKVSGGSTYLIIIIMTIMIVVTIIMLIIIMLVITIIIIIMLVTTHNIIVTLYHLYTL